MTEENADNWIINILIQNNFLKECLKYSNIPNNKNSLYNQNQGQYITYNNFNQNPLYFNNSQKQYIPPSSQSINNYNNNFYQNSPNNYQRFTPKKNTDYYSNETLFLFDNKFKISR